MQFGPLKFETKLVIKPNYNLYIHLYIHINFFKKIYISNTPSKYLNYFIFTFLHKNNPYLNF